MSERGVWIIQAPTAVYREATAKHDLWDAVLTLAEVAGGSVYVGMVSMDYGHKVHIGIESETRPAPKHPDVKVLDSSAGELP